MNNCLVRGLAVSIAVVLGTVVSAGVAQAGPTTGTTQSDDPSVAAAFSFTRYATVSPSADWSFVAGNFAGDSRADVVGYHPSNGSLWVGTNTGSSFSFTQYATVSPPAEWSFVAGNFAGDSRADVMGYHPSNGSLWVGTTVN